MWYYKTMTLGQIYKIHSDFYYVDDGTNFIECKVREILKKLKKKILVGDFVEFDKNVITNIIERKNQIMRPSVANIDQIIIVSALKEPDLDFAQLNRYIALAEYHHIKPILCFNKSDLHWDKSLKSKIKDIYENLGYETVFCSATEQKGIDTITKLLKSKISVLCGSSGAGKSSLVNALNPNLNIRTKSVSEKTQRGTHTTRHCEIVKVNEDSRIVDTPGFSNVKFDFILPAEVDLLFPEIAQFRDNCKFKDCLHTNEVGCSVLANLDKIDISRYESYINFLNEAKEYKERIKYEGKKIENFNKSINSKQVAKISEKKRQGARSTLKQNIYKELT